MTGKSSRVDINERETRRLVRRHADGTLTLKPGVDFTNPPEYPSRLSEFLRKRLPSLKHLVPGGHA
jgi:hypothetical protein